MKAHEMWWEENLDARAADLAGWLEPSDPRSREVVVQLALDLHRHERLTHGVLECGPGLFTDYIRHWSQHPAIAYQAIDVTPKIVARGQLLGLTIGEGSVEAIPLPDRAVSVAYCRHVVEHLPDYKSAVLELMRVSRETAAVVFFRLDTTGATDTIAFDTVAEARGLYHNTYSQQAISAWLNQQPGWAHTWLHTGADWVLSIRRV